MTPEIQAAAEELYKILYSTTRAPAKQRLLTIKVVEAILTQHTDDDGNEPVTEEWLRSVGFNVCAHWGAMDTGNRKHSTALEWDHGKWAVVGVNGHFDVSLPIPPPETRQQVRDLLRALGIKSKEQP